MREADRDRALWLVKAAMLSYIRVSQIRTQGLSQKRAETTLRIIGQGKLVLKREN